MKFGLLLPNFGASAGGEIIAASARLAEARGFDSVWTTDHVLMPADMPEPYGNLIESLVALTIAATATEVVQLGTSIIVMPQREPVLLAKQLAGIDVASGGRLILGAGVGWLEREFNYLGADYENRGPRFDEWLALTRALWDGDGAFTGESKTIDEALFAPRPPRGAATPVWIGGNSSYAISRAAAIADGWHPVGLTPAELKEGLEQLRALDNGRAVTASLRTNIELLAPGEAARGYSAPGHVPRGSAGEILAELKAYQEAGLEYAVIWLFHESWDELEAKINLFADEVLPTFQ
ncbi:MAG: TIGR03619 family F420-dependent LLM class oxidoreductase [Chloroflexota bacterium]|nr:TIGR03619 family F420-dependent LLM class oxidoreductase [Chloroflexota bacterium]